MLIQVSSQTLKTTPHRSHLLQRIKNKTSEEDGSSFPKLLSGSSVSGCVLTEFSSGKTDSCFKGKENVYKITKSSLDCSSMSQFHLALLVRASFPSKISNVMNQL